MAAASLVSGAVSGMMGVATGFPLETLRVRMQTQVAREEYRGPWDCLVKTVRGEGEKKKNKKKFFVSCSPSNKQTQDCVVYTREWQVLSLVPP